MNEIPFAIMAIYIFIFGLCTGSFLNVVILRSLSNENFVLSRSRCPKCKKQLKWYMNIPVFSYIFLKGRCAFCKNTISIQYPLVEIVCALSFLGSYLAFNMTLKTIFVCIILSFFILLAGTDFKETVIIDTHAYILTFIGLLYSILKLSDISLAQAIIGSIFGFLFFEILARLTKKIIGTRMFGEGDSLIALALGAIFGCKILAIIIILSFIFQCLFAIPIMAYNAQKNKKKSLAISYLFVLIGMLSVFFVNYFKLLNDFEYLIFALLITIFLMWAFKNIIKEILIKKDALNNKNDENILNSSFYLMPFGPALIFSATICLFFLSNIKEIILNFLIV